MYVHLLLLGVVSLWSVEAQVAVDTKYGPVEGHPVPMTDGRSINSFLGIPFAKPPVLELRWQPPQEPDPWELFVADELSSACIQNLIGELILTHPGWLNVREDCLNVNIYTPEDMSGGPYPVMVWFHGGAYQGSANIQYPGHFLALRDVVVVVPNYRLGILGFASTGDEVAPGNYGMLDQNLALKFVQENIENFGGDPNKVTILGQSAGAGSVGLHLLSPMSRDLFHQAVLHSGSEFSVWAINDESVKPHEWIHSVAERRNCSRDNNQDMMDCLRTIGPRTLLHTQFNCSFCLGFAPVVDGPDGFLPAHPIEMRQNESFAKVPMMEGITREDGFLYALAFGIGGNLTDFDGVTREEFEQWLQLAVQLFGYILEDPEMEEDVYQALNFYYSPWPHLDDESANLHQLAMMITDVGFGYPTDSQIKMHSDHADSYYWVFGFRGDNHSALLPEWMGVPHMLDLPYVFGYPMLEDNPLVRNDTQMWRDPIDWTDEDEEVADFVMDMWTNFAKFGNPTPVPMQDPITGKSHTWEAFTNEELNYLYLANDDVEVRENYRQRDYAFWTYYLNQMVFGDEITPPHGVLGSPALNQEMGLAFKLYTQALARHAMLKWAKEARLEDWEL